MVEMENIPSARFPSLSAGYRTIFAELIDRKPNCRKLIALRSRALIDRGVGLGQDPDDACRYQSRHDAGARIFHGKTGRHAGVCRHLDGSDDLRALRAIMSNLFQL